MKKLIQALEGRKDKTIKGLELYDLLHDNCLEESFVGYKRFQFVENPSFWINKESGELERVIKNDRVNEIHFNLRKNLSVSTYKLNIKDEYIKLEGDLIYIYEIRLIDHPDKEQDLMIRYAQFTFEPKKEISFKINEQILEEFKEKTINPSQIIEDFMKDYVEKNR